MCLKIFSSTQNKVLLEPIQDFSLRFGPTIRKLSAVENRIIF